MGTEVYYKNGSSAADRSAAAKRWKVKGYTTRWTKRDTSWMGDGNIQYTLHYTKKKR